MTTTTPKRKYTKRTFDTHIYDRVNYLLETAEEHKATYSALVGSLKQEPWHCPMGWMRSQLVTGLEAGWENEHEREENAVEEGEFELSY